MTDFKISCVLGAPRRRSTALLFHQQCGLTLIEMIVTISLMTILLSMSYGAMTYYFAGRSLDSAVRELTTEIREAQAMAVSRGNTYRIVFNNDDTFQVARYVGDELQNEGNALSLPSGVHFNGVNSGGDSVLELYARGESEDATISLRGKFGMSRTIVVDGATVNVSETG